VVPALQLALVQVHQVQEEAQHQAQEQQEEGRPELHVW
jgi:hypothetical protein